MCRVRGGDLSCEIAFTKYGRCPFGRLSVDYVQFVPSRVLFPSSGSSWRQRGNTHCLSALKSEAGAFNRVIRIGSNAVAGEMQITVRGNSFDAPVPVRRRFGFGKTRVKIK